MLSTVRVTAAPAVSMNNEAVLAGFFRRRSSQERAAFTLYGAAVSAARDPYLYTELGLPDTLDGRFDAISLHVILLIRRLNADGPDGQPMAQAVFDAMFRDMDINLREMGVSDLSVGKRNRAMWEALHGRAAAYTEAWSDVSALSSALARNLWRGATPPDGAPEALARIAYGQAANLKRQETSQLMQGTVDFLSAQEASSYEP
jgi:cytochrome b pre-mRNA-processing protein 3